MGIFSNRNAQDVPDGNAAGGYSDPGTYGQPVNSDGMLPQADGSQAQPYGSYGTPTAPPLDNTVAPPADYIMTGEGDQAPPPPPADQPAPQEPAGEPIPVHASVSTTTQDSTAPDDLVHIKQQALQQLSPLISHLEQSPEERFRTTMMMLQATDDQSLVKTAYEAAQAITDEKTKAQALLDIVNEINYFSQKHH